MEPELTLHLGKDLPVGADRDTARAAIAAIGPAIEIADVDYPSDDVEGMLACNIYQRHVILGRSEPARAGGILDGLAAHVLRSGAEIASISDPQSLQNLTGELLDIVRHTAELLAAFGESLQAGQIIIAGSFIPPLWVAPGEEIVFHLAPVDAICIRFAPASNRTPC